MYSVFIQNYFTFRELLKAPVGFNVVLINEQTKIIMKIYNDKTGSTMQYLSLSVSGALLLLKQLSL